MFPRCLSGNARQQARKCLTKFDTRAAVDRYSTISRFFRNQGAGHSRRCPSLHGSSVLEGRHLVSFELGAVGGEGSRISFRGVLNARSFGSSSYVRDSQRSSGLKETKKQEDGRQEGVQEARTTEARADEGTQAGNLQMKSSGDQTVNKTGSTFQYAENYSKFFQRLARSLPPMQRPTREDFLNVANGFWQRMRVRFKWFTVRSFRKFNADDISAFFTWFLVSQTAWILLGTTTFFSVVFATINSLRMQERVARAISDYLTSETGVTIVFESAIVPKWKDSRIAFKNVYVSRRPPSQHKTAPVDQNAAHRAVASYDPSNHPAFYGLDEEYNRAPPPVEEDVDYSVFDLNIDSVDVTLSLTRWLDGKGLVQDAVIKGVRGILDRRYIHYDPENPWDPASFRHATQPGDFQLESLQLEDVLITVYQPGSFRPYTSSIFRADIKTFRKQWMFYDFLSAENVVGQFDNCLFSLHKPQSIGRTTEQELQDGAWSRMSRVRIDGVNIDHIQRASTMEGPIAWITSGKVDAVFDIRFPREADDHAIDELLGGIAEVITSVASNQAASLFERIPGQRELAKPAISAPEDPPVDPADAPRVVSIDIDLRFRDLKAAVPIFTSELSYVNSALIRPIVAFINANRTLVPIHCRVIKDISDFDGSWTMWETGLVDEIALKVYDALAYHVTVANFNRRVKTVSLWSLQKTASAALSTLQTIMTPMSAYLQELKG